MLRGSGQQEAILREAQWYFTQPCRDHREAVWVAAIAGWAALGSENWGQSVAWADRGLALGSGDEEAIGRLRFCAGTALIYTGDLFRAEQELLQITKMTESVPVLRSLAGDACFNLGFVNRALDRPEPELQWFRKAAEQCRRQGRRSRELACLHEIGWCHLIAGRPAEALPALDGARAGLPTDGYPELEADLQIAMALYHSLTGAPYEAETLCLNLMNQVDLLGRQQAEIYWILGRSALVKGDRAQAILHVDDAFAAAVEDWWPPQVKRIEQFRRSLVHSVGKGR
jgi:tetratricopeptide (TPR) repeat protein